MAQLVSFSCSLPAWCSCRALGAAQRCSSHPSTVWGWGLVPTMSCWRSWQASWNKEAWHFLKCYLLLVVPQERSCAHFQGQLRVYWRRSWLVLDTWADPGSRWWGQKHCPHPQETLLHRASSVYTSEPPCATATRQPCSSSPSREAEPLQPKGITCLGSPTWSQAAGLVWSPPAYSSFPWVFSSAACKEPCRADGGSVRCGAARRPAVRRPGRHPLRGARRLPRVPRAFSRLAPPACPSWQVSRAPLLPSPQVSRLFRAARPLLSR